MRNQKKGFALPTVLISSVVLLSILVTAVTATVAVRTSLQDQEYTRLAQLAGEAGTAYGISCLEKTGGTVTWTTMKPLMPNTDCNGDAILGVSEYVAEDNNLRTYFVVDPPSPNGTINGEGFIEVLRESTGTAWRFWEADVASALGGNSSVNPVGTSIEGYWTTPPVGYLLENGAAVSRTEYAALFAVIGTTFGAGDGSTTFNLPDSRGRVSVNLNAADAEFNTIGETSGAKTHTLTIAQMPSHSHTQNAHTHNNTLANASAASTTHVHGTTNVHARITYAGSPSTIKLQRITGVGSWSSNYSLGVASAATGGGTQTTAAQVTGNTNSPSSTVTTSISNASTTATNQNTGSGQAHNNIQPSIVVTRAIKY